MPIFGIFASIGGTLAGIATFLTGGSLAATVVKVGIGIAAAVAQKALSKKSASQPAEQPTPQASQIGTVYGETQPRTVILGRVGTDGHHIYRNAYPPEQGNRIVQDVYVLSHFRIQGVTRVRIDGAWRTLGGEESHEIGFKVQGIEADIWVKVHIGTMDQAADNGLVARANPPGRWTAAHRGAGVAYAIVTSFLTRDHLPSPAEVFFEVEGPLLYDWRKDDTAGGDGDDRWSSQATWSGNFENPILMAYALERGLFNGSQLMVGKRVDASRLPIARWTLGANICDELVGGAARYRASCIVSSGAGVTHDANLQPLLEACAASWVEKVGEEYPIVGAAQSSVATITDDDIMPGEPYRCSKFRPTDQLVNTVAGSYMEPEKFYEAAPLATRVDDTALAADGETLAVSVAYGAVIYPANADRLNDIALRASRYQANASICLHPRCLERKPGEWITWQSARNNWTKTFLILSKQLGSLGSKGTRNVYVTLQEVSAGIFDPTAYETLPPDAVGQGAPDYQTELDNFVLAPRILQSDGKQFPCIRASWDPIDDATVIFVDLEYWPVDDPTAKLPIVRVPDDQTVVDLANGIFSDRTYAAHYRLVTATGVRPWSPTFEITTPDAATADILVTLANLQADIRNALERMARRYDLEIVPFLEELARSQALGEGRNRQGLSAVTRTADKFAAAFLDFQAVVDSELGALATAIVGVQVNVDNLAAGGRISFRAQIPPPDGVLASIEVMVRVTDDDDFVESGLLIQAVDVGGGNIEGVVAVLADRFIVTDGTVNGTPIVFQSGQMTLASMRAQTITAARLQNVAGTSFIDMSTGTIDLTF